MKKVIGISLIKDIRRIDEWLDTTKEIFTHAVLFITEKKFIDVVRKKLSARSLSWIILENVEAIPFNCEQTMRSRIWSKVRDIGSEGDWIFSLDSDELPCKEVEAMKVAFQQLPDDVQAITFRKLDMWNEEEDYRLDGIWSSYFIKAAKFKDCEFELIQTEKEDYVRGDDGFHLPTYCYKYNAIWNSDMRIRSYKYSSPDKRKERLEMVQKWASARDWLVTAHLKTINETPYIKKYDGMISLPKVALNIVLVREVVSDECLAKLTQVVKNYLGNLQVNFFTNTDAEKSEQKVIEWIKKEAIDVPVQIWPVKIENAMHITAEEYGVKKAIYQQFVEIKDVDYVGVFDSHHSFDPTIINHMCMTERDVIVDLRKTIRYAYMISQTILSKISFDDMIKGKVNDVLGLIDWCEKNEVVAWGVGTGMPASFTKTVQAKYKKFMAPFVSSHEGIKPEDYVVK